MCGILELLIFCNKVNLVEVEFKMRLSRCCVRADCDLLARHRLLYGNRY